MARRSGTRQPLHRPRRHRRALLGALGLPVLLLAATCRPPPETAGEPPAPSTTAESPLLARGDGPVTIPGTMVPPGVELADTRGVHLLPVVGGRPPGPAKAAVALSGGSSRIVGVARGPNGPVAGATVRVERFVDDQVGRRDLVAGSDGSFELRGLPGGRYRVRAWSRPSLTVTQPALIFLDAQAGHATAPLDLERHSAITMIGAIGASRWQVGQQTGVSVLLSQEYVDGEGIARNGGVAGAAITLHVPAGLQLSTEPTVVTGDDGYARFGVTCAVAGSYALEAESSGFTRPIPAPACNPPLPPPTASAFDVGRSFDTPASGPYPPGTYTAEPAMAPRCVTVYEVQIGEAWQRQEAGAVITAAGPVRALSPAPGTAPCTYRRTS